MKDKYEIVVGLEVHVQLSTESKIFCADATQYGCPPNTNISVISLAHPGTLPKINRKTIDFAVKMGLACACKITQHNIFSRKNYFYPDLPKGYQLTQDKEAICMGGHVEIQLKDKTRKIIRLNHIHLEEDAGKSIHLENESDSQVDYNRAGVPLIEIVTEPDLRSAEEAALFLQEVRRLVRYLDICDGNMEEGSLRCDANVSVRLKGAEKLGTRVEIKNLNSFRFVQKAIEYEAERQINALETGHIIIQETRNFDSNTGITTGMRTKENLNDYRYFPEPDLNPVIISDEWLAEIRNAMPALPKDLFHKFTTKYALSEYDTLILIDTKETAAYFEQTILHTAHYKAVANWLNGTIKSYLNENHLNISDLTLAPDKLAELVNLIADNKLSNSTASNNLFPLLLAAPETSVLELAKQHNLLIDSNEDELQAIIRAVLAENIDKVRAYQNGKKGLQAMFMGEVMKRTKGKADPKLTNKLLMDALNKA